MLLPTITLQQSKFANNNNNDENWSSNAECGIESSGYKDKSHLDNNSNTSAVVSNYLHCIRRYST